MIQFLTLDAVIAGLAISYIITLCANWNEEKRSYGVCVLLFVINAALVIATVVNEDVFGQTTTRRLDSFCVDFFEAVWGQHGFFRVRVKV